MRREQRKNRKNDTNTMVYISGGILAVAIIAFIITFVVYSNRLNSNSSGILDTQFLSNAEDNNILDDNTTSASSSMGKTVEESENELEENNNITQDTKTEKNEAANNSTNTTTEKTSTTNKTEATTKEQKDPTFVSPIESSDILREYAKDNLVYSETLKEWITHLGIDIKAEKATVVKAGAEGTVKSIKNDPRYGLTIIIEHSNGYQTLYANLLTTEFVSEGEKVKSGQTIGTVGDTAVYEVVDEPHLHFEITKNGENLNPSELIKF